MPERHGPDVGELNFTYLFDVINEVSARMPNGGWQGWVAYEYRPKSDSQFSGTLAGLGWAGLGWLHKLDSQN